MKKSLLTAAIALLLIMSGITAFFLHLQHYAETPARAKSDNTVIIIPAGQSFNVITDVLAKADIIKDPYKFKMVARMKGYDKKLQAGEYVLSATMSPQQILQKMVSGAVKL